MNSGDLARTLHGKRSGRRWSCRCPGPLHKNGDRNRSLSVWDAEDGWTCLHCFTGCTRAEILSAIGLEIRDLGPENTLTWEQRRESMRRTEDRRRLEVMEHRHGLFILLSVAEPGRRNYYRAAERNTAVEIRQLRDRIYPEEKLKREREAEVQRIIADYGLDELWRCVP